MNLSGQPAKKLVCLMRVNTAVPKWSETAPVKMMMEPPAPATIADPTLLAASFPVEASRSKGRLDREWRTLAAMLAIYCRSQHGTAAGLCPDCHELHEYARIRLDRCRFGETKPTCAQCPVHCYQAKRRDQVKVMMRSAGPRMLWRHPILCLRHWLDGRRAFTSVSMDR